MDSGNMGDPDHTGHTDHDNTDHTGHTDQAITQVASEESSKPKNGGQSSLVLYSPPFEHKKAKTAQWLAFLCKQFQTNCLNSS